MAGPELAAREATANTQTRPLPSLQPRKGHKHKSNDQGNGNRTTGEKGSSEDVELGPSGSG